MKHNTRVGINEAIAYVLENEAEGRRALKALASAFSTRRERLPEHHRVYFDTFDWRLYERGLRLATGRRNGSGLLRLESPDFSLEAPLAKNAAPSFGPRLPGGPLKALLCPILELRRLLPLVKIATRSHGLRILEGEQKTVARVHVVHTDSAPPRSRSAPRPLAPRLTLTPVRGYGEQAKRVTRHLETELGLTRASSSAYEEMLASVDLRPGSYSSKLILPIQRRMSAGEAVQVICRHLLKTMMVNEDGVRRDLDSEFLHDFRVAVRRTRAALAQLEGVFDAEARRFFKSEFKWLGAVTGPVRDLDVHLLQMDPYREALPSEVRRDLEPLATYLSQHRQTERQKLKTDLATRRYRRLVARWGKYLQAPLPEPALSKAAQLPVIEVASARIWRAYRKVEDISAGIDDLSPADTLHRLRIECKKLRYLLEFFHPLYDARVVQPLIKSLKRLQDSLGDFNDLEVQQGTLKRFAREMQDEGLASVDCLLAMGRLQGHHDERKRTERQRFARCLGEFDAPANRKRFARLFESTAGEDR
jgi:CHAD domain-containing protein